MAGLQLPVPSVRERCIQLGHDWILRLAGGDVKAGHRWFGDTVPRSSLPALPARGSYGRRKMSLLRQRYSTTYRSIDAPESFIGRDVSSSNPVMPYPVTRGHVPERSV
jgi:hypothetical protein